MLKCLNYKSILGDLVVFGAMVSVVFVVALGTATGGKITKRQSNQQDRIRQGVTSKALTVAEAFQLRKEQGKIRAMKRAAWSDGRLSKKERICINWAQNKASKQIYRAKHNKRTR